MNQGRIMLHSITTAPADRAMQGAWGSGGPCVVATVTRIIQGIKCVLWSTKCVAEFQNVQFEFLKRWQACSRTFIIYPLITIFIKEALKIACLFSNNASASGGLCSPGRGVPPLDPAGDVRPRDTSVPETSSCVQCDFRTILGPG